ncbi:hypothetical protein PIB30_086270, partial [Stylosanthes scabra]|nr:hypothetical protein [Stylosanthes scabra]
MAQGKLLSADRMARIMGSSPHCHNCHKATCIETILHALRDCPHVASVWSRIIAPIALMPFLSTNLEEWVELNMQNEYGA